MNHKLEKERIGKLILQFSVPAMIAILVNTIYNIIDRIYIGRVVGTEALAGLTVVYPIMLVIFAGSALIARGGANLLSINLGQKNREEGHKVFTATIVTTVIFGLLMSIVGLVTLKPVLNLLGASGDVLSHGYDYMSYIYIGVIVWILSFTLSSTVRAEGQATLSMIAMVVSAVTNIVLDYMFIVIMDMGVRGAAIGTIIAQTVGFLILAYYYLNGASSVRIRRKYLRPNLYVVRKLLTIGLPSYFVTVGSGVSLMVLNYYLGRYGGVASVASIGAIGSLMAFFNIPVLGIQNGIQPIIGFNHGAGNDERVRETVKQSLVVTIFAGIIIFIVIRLFADHLMGMFMEGQLYDISQGAEGLRIYSLLIPFTSIINVSIAYLQSTEHALQATLISLSKQIVILIPSVILLSTYWGLIGIWYAVPVADGVSILLASAIILSHNRRSKEYLESVTS